MPGVWLLGVGPAAGIVAAALLWKHHSKFGVPEFAMAGVAAALLIGLLIGGFRGESADRLIAALYNVVVVICALVALSAGRNLRFYDVGIRSTHPLVIFFFLYAAFVVGSYGAGLMLGQPELGFPSLLTGQIYTELPGLLNLYTKAKITGVDWGGGAGVPRPLAFGVYYNEGSLVFLLCGLLAAALAPSLKSSVSIYVLLVAGLLLTGSRGLILAFCVFGALALMFATSFAREVKILVLAAGIIVVLLATAVAPEILLAPAEDVFAARAASTSTRMKSYELAIQMTVETNPVTGLGVKPRDSSTLGIPIGSHSSIVSTFTKSGVLGTLPLVVLMATIVAVGVRLLLSLDILNATGRRRAIPFAIGALSIVAWMTFEDFDAPIVGAVIAFLFIGVAQGFLDRMKTAGSRRGLKRTKQRLTFIGPQTRSEGWLSR